MQEYYFSIHLSRSKFKRLNKTLMKTALHNIGILFFVGVVSLIFEHNASAQLAYIDGRVTFDPESSLILPVKPTICPSSYGVELVANVSDLDGRFSYLWSGPSNDGAVTKSIVATVAGEYKVSVWEKGESPIAILTTHVLESKELSTANPGNDDVLCFYGELKVNLEGTAQGPATWMWQGGEGDFLNGRHDLNGTYVPTAAEIEQGYVNLVLVPELTTGCEITPKPLHIEFITFDSDASVFIRHASSDISSDASVEFSFTGGAQPLSYQWSNGSTLPYVSNLGKGTYELKITDANGCEAHSTVNIVVELN